MSYKAGLIAGFLELFVAHPFKAEFKCNKLLSQGFFLMALEQDLNSCCWETSAHPLLVNVPCPFQQKSEVYN